MGVPQHPAARGRAVYLRRPPPNVSAALQRQPRGGDATNHESRDASAAKAIDLAIRGPLATPHGPGSRARLYRRRFWLARLSRAFAHASVAFQAALAIAVSRARGAPIRRTAGAD